MVKAFLVKFCLSFLILGVAIVPTLANPSQAHVHKNNETFNIVQNPSNVPVRPNCTGEGKTVPIYLESKELNGWLDKTTSYHYWTFNSKVPGPMYRVCVGDMVEVHLKNNHDNILIHSIDFHAATGSGGGSIYSQAESDEEKIFTFKALHSGLYIYHCATPVHAQHIASGMYGMLLVEPKGGLTPVDREFYVMQGEIYSTPPVGNMADFDYDSMINEKPKYLVFNGAVGALSETFPLKAKVGETIRIFFGVGGPNLASSFHIIGETFDRVYLLGSISSPPLEDVQTILVPPGGSSIVELKLEVPGEFLLVDHALGRLEKGLIGKLIVEGKENKDTFKQLLKTNN